METVAYQEEFGQVRFPEGFEQTLRGLSVEEQMNRYRTTCRRSYSMTGFGSRTQQSGYRTLEDDSDVRALIVRDGLVVGVMMRDDCGHTVPCLAEERVCTYYACDDNGAGYKTRIDYTWLLCVPAGFEE